MSSPNNLAIYLSNRCDLACGYCYVAVNKGEPTFLSVDSVVASITTFLARPSTARRKVSFLGGEPLLRFDILSEAVRRARELGGLELLIQVYTNGTALTPERFEFLHAYGVDITVSLDGRKETQDANRPLHGREGSSFELAAANLAKLPAGVLGANMVFTARGVDRLLADIEHLRGRGFGRISFTPDVKERWTLARVDDLRRVMEGFRRYYRLLLRSRSGAFAIANLYALLERTRRSDGPWWKDCDNLVLGADGRYYACDKSLGFEFGRSIEGEGVGTAEAGPDWDKREAAYVEARRLILERPGDANAYASCPMGVLFLQRGEGAEAEEALAGFEAVSRAYGEPLLELAAELWDDPAFRRLHPIDPSMPRPTAPSGA